MNVRSRQESTFEGSVPRTLVGRWLFADAFDRRDERAVHVGDIRKTGGWTPGRVAVVQNAFRGAVRQLFSGIADASQVRDFVRNGIEHFGSPDELRYLEVEWLVRHALGEALSIEVLDFRRAFLVQRLFFTYATDLRSMSASVVGGLIVEAERRAVANGDDPLPNEERIQTGVTLDRILG